jgi:hypothetical protein
MVESVMMLQDSGHNPLRTFIVRRWLFARSLWPALAVVAACVPFAAGFSLTNIFYIRDLSMFFWPRHLWIHRTLASGSWPLWDPYAAAGQPAFPDALNQLFLPPAILLRLLPAIPGFNLIVMLPFPLAALGTWLFLRRHVSEMSAALGAVVFAASGPVVSTGNFPNLSWSVAWIPWVLWAADRDRRAPSARGFALVTSMIVLQIVSGEPVTMVGTVALLVAYVAAGAAQASLRAQVRCVSRIVGAIAVAAAISVVQLVPMALAARASARAVLRPDNFWSVHPLWLCEALLPQLFGDTFLHYDAELPWIAPLNSGRDPFFFSLYIGTAAFLMSTLGSLVGSRPWRFFWLAVAVAGLLLAFGNYTPVYPLLQQIAPPLRSFRFPAKFLVFTSFGIAVLAANAIDWLGGARERSPLPAAVKSAIGVGVAGALTLVIAIALVSVAPFTAARAFYNLAARVGVADPVSGAAYLFKALPPVGIRTLSLLVTSTLLVYLGWTSGEKDGRARLLLFGMATVELLVTHVGLNPVLPASWLGPPEWTAALAADPAARYYFGGKFRRGLVENDVDLRGIAWRPLEGVTVGEGRTLLMANVATAPEGWGVRELLSNDLAELWPFIQMNVATLFERADRPERLRFLARGGVRYCLLSSPPYPGAPPIHRVGERFGQMAVYECVPNARRAYIVPRAEVIPDTTTQLRWLFDESFDADSTVMLERTPPDAAGSPGTPSTASARITVDRDREVAIEAAAGNDGGYVVLLDSFDRDWRVEVDGRAAPLLRANALYRAVRVTPGSHTVVFAHRPTALYVCLLISSLTVLALAVAAVRRR